MSSHQPFQNLPGKVKRNSLRLWIRPGQISSCWDNFCTRQKLSEEWKKTSACLKKSLRNYTLSGDLTHRKTKPDFEIQLCATFLELSPTVVAVVVKTFTYL